MQEREFSYMVYTEQVFIKKQIIIFMEQMKTNMRGFQNFIKRNPRKRLNGYFVFNGRGLTHQEVVRVVNYAVEKGYETDADIPSEELEKLLKG